MSKVLSPRMHNDWSFNVAAFGATGDGTTNDYAAIQAALDAAGTYASTNKGAVVVIPLGQYKISSTLVCPSNVTISAYGAYIFSGNSNYMLSTYTVTGANYTSGNSNINIHGGIWDAKGQSAATDDNYNIFTLSSGRNVNFKDVTCRNVPGFHAIDINTMDGVVVDSCRFEGFVDNTTGLVRFFSEAVQLQENTTSPCKNISVVNSYMGPAIDGSGLGSFGKLVGSHTNTLNTIHTNVRVIGNVVDGAKDAGIQAQSWKDSTIANNIIRDTVGHGIRCVQTVNHTCSRITITGNTISEYAVAGIFMDGNTGQVFSGCIVSNNTLESTVATSSGLRLEFFNDSIASGNVIKDGAQHGIIVASCTDSVIENNNIRDVDLSGIAVDAGTRNIVSGNRIYNVGNRGIWLANTTTKNMINGNLVIGASRATNNTYGGIEVSASNNSDNVISNNRIGKFGSGNEAPTPIVFAGTASTGIQIGNNSYDGFTQTNYMKSETSNSETTSSATYVSLTTVQTLTLHTGTAAFVHFGAVVDFNTGDTGVAAFIGVDITGATTRPPTSLDELRIDRDVTAGSNFDGDYRSYLFTGLTPGANVFTLKFKSDGSDTRAFDERVLMVTPVIL